MFWAAEIIISTKKITLIDYQKQNFILILVQLIIVKFLDLGRSLELSWNLVAHCQNKAPTHLWNNLGKERYVDGKFGYLIA